PALLLLARPRLRRAARAPLAQRAPLEPRELHPRGGRRDLLLHHLLDPGLPEGHRLVPVRDQPDPLLGVRGRVDLGPTARDLGVVLRRRPCRRAPVHLRVRAPGARRRGEPAALLLPPRDHRLRPPTRRATPEGT